MSGGAQPRDTSGRFDRSRRSLPEVTLGAADGSPAVGDRVRFGSVPGHRVIEVSGDLLTLRPPQGGFVLAKPENVTVQIETPEERETNLGAETAIARMLTSVKALSRQRREDLDRDTGDAERHALDALALLYASGRMQAEQYVQVMTATRNAPLRANHAALAIIVRDRLSAEHYETLTAGVRRAGGILPV